MGIALKILTWVRANGASVIGSIQAVLKAIKELLTAVVNLLSLFMPTAASNGIITAIRAGINTVDGAFEVIKKWLLQI